MPSEQDVFFESLYHEHYKKLYILANNQLNDASASEEIVQDTFCTAFQRLSELQQSKKPAGYLCRILQNKLHEYQRSQMRDKRLFVVLSTLFPSNKPANPSIPTSVSSILKAVEAALSEEEWATFQIYFLQNGGHIQVSKKQGISVWASQKRIQRIRKKLEKILPDF